MLSCDVIIWNDTVTPPLFIFPENFTHSKWPAYLAGGNEYKNEEMEEGRGHGLINYIDTKAKCRHLKNYV